MQSIKPVIPGLALSCLCAIGGILLQRFLELLFGHLFLEGLVIALILGMLWRNLKGCSKELLIGTQFASKEILEFAVVLLGASLDFHFIFNSGLFILFAVSVAITLVLILTRWLGQLLGLSRNTAILLGVGNGICGNSAIAAIAPIIGADSDEVASSIGFTAVLSIFVVIALPLLPKFIPLTIQQYGVVVGMVVYAVPQVLAASFPVGPESVAIATVVKLTRVLFLTPVALFFTVRNRNPEASRISIGRYIPWFMIGFFILALLRTLGILNVAQGDWMRDCGKILTVISMGAIGLNVDLRKLANNSVGVVLTVLASLLCLLILSILAAHFIA